MADEEKADPTQESAAAAEDRQDASASDASASDDEVGRGAAEVADEDATGQRNGHKPEESGDESGELVGAGAPRRGRARSAERRAGASALASTDLRRKDGKDKATPKRRPSAAERTRTGPITFVRESVGELRKVVYPTGQQLLNYFVVVLVFVLFVIAFVSLLDLAFGAAIFEVFS